MTEDELEQLGLDEDDEAAIAHHLAEHPDPASRPNPGQMVAQAHYLANTPGKGYYPANTSSDPASDNDNAEDKPAQPVRQPQEDRDHADYGGIAGWRRGPSLSREDVVRALHATSLETLTALRKQRDHLEDEIRVLVGEEYRLRRMVGIIDRANKDDGQETRDVETDPS